MVGKLSFDTGKLSDNVDAFITHIKQMKPATTKGTYIKTVSISATMSPGVRINVA